MINVEKQKHRGRRETEGTEKNIFAFDNFRGTSRSSRITLFLLNFLLIIFARTTPALGAEQSAIPNPQSAIAREVTLGASNFEPGTARVRIEAFFNDAGVSHWAAGGVTSWESYVRWNGIEQKRGAFDFSMYDAEVEILKNNGLKWVPFLIAGPNYTTPVWFMDSADVLFYRCLEHGVDGGVQSMFNPRLKPRVEEFISQFAAHYRGTGAIENVLLGITGDYGEAIYPVMDIGHWTGHYHQHPGYWAGDREAKKSFVHWLTVKYQNVDSLNKSWTTSFTSLEDAAPFLPENRPSDAAWLDMITWYRESIESWADFWMAATRENFPDTRIYLCTGGDGVPQHGSRFGRQAKIAAKYHAGVRITNEGSDYARNFTLTRWVKSACAFYGCYFGFEPASGVSEPAVVRRVYNVTASAADQLFEYSGNAWGGAWKGGFDRWLNEFIPVQPITPAAAFIPETYLALNPDQFGFFYQTMQFLREIGDFDFVDEGMAADGALDKYQIIIIHAGGIVDDAAAAALYKWVRNGGMIAGPNLEHLRTVSGEPVFPDMEGKSVKSTSLKDIAKPYGSGIIASYTDEVTEMMRLSRSPRLFEHLFYKACRISEQYPCLPAADSPSDGVFTTLTSTGLLMLNTTDNVYETTVSPHEPSLRLLGVTKSILEAMNIHIEPQSMAFFPF